MEWAMYHYIELYFATIIKNLRDPQLVTKRGLTDKQQETHGWILSIVVTDALWPLLLTWFNFNPSMDK